MTIWILVAVVGGILSVVDVAALVRRYRRGVIRGRYLLACVVGCFSLASFAFLDAFRTAGVSGPVTIALLLPAFIAIGVIVREHRRGAVLDQTSAPKLP